MMEFIFTHATFASCHASTIVVCRDHTLLAAWFGGTAESNPDVKIYTSRLKDGKWSEPIETASGMTEDGQPRACYNPVLFQPSKGPLMLFYKVGTGPQTWWGMMTTSTDNGQTWTTPHRLPHGFYGPIKNKPIELNDGSILCPSSSEDHGWRIHFEQTKDLGKSWSRIDPIAAGKPKEAIQPSILRLTPNHLRAIGRTKHGRLFTTDSDDNGKTWSPLELSFLRNPNSGTDAVTLKNGMHLLVYNPTTTGRTPLVLAASWDGEHWKEEITLESTPGEYSYPAIIQTSDGKVHITYTWKRERIAHVVIDPKDIK